MFKEAYKLETGVAKIPEGTTKIENYAFCNNRRIRCHLCQKSDIQIQDHPDR